MNNTDLMEVELPDGRILEFPAGTSPDVIQRTARRFLSQGVTAKTKPATTPQMPYDPTEGMGGGEKFLAGIGKSFSDIGLGVRQYLPEAIGGVSNEEIERRRKLDEPLMRTGAGQAGNIVGTLATAIPTALVPGANTMLGAAAIGGGMGALQPSESIGGRLGNIGLGAVTASVIPAAIQTYKTGKALLEPLYGRGREQIKGRFLNEMAGQHAPDVLQRLKNPSILVEGSRPTVGELAGVPSLAAAHRTLVATNPNATNLSMTREAAQNQARIDALRKITPDRAAAEAEREAMTSHLYRLSEPRTVEVTSDLGTLMKRPSMRSALQRAKGLAEEAGEDLRIVNAIPETAGLIQNSSGKALTTSPAQQATISGKAAHYIKMALDDMSKAQPSTGIGGNELRAIQQTRGDYLNLIEKQLPEYGQARQGYAKLSRPINQADIMQEVERRATNFRGDITPAAYSRAVSDSTAKSVLKQPRATLAEAMEPEQMDIIKRIGEDLLRSDFAKTAGRGVGSDTIQKLAYSNIMNQAGLPNALRSFAPASIVGNLAARVGQAAYRDANDTISRELAETMFNPQAAAELMEGALVSPEMRKLANALRRTGTLTGAATPALVQANKQ